MLDCRQHFPKLARMARDTRIGIPYFDATREGFGKGAKAFGGRITLQHW